MTQYSTRFSFDNIVSRDMLQLCEILAFLDLLSSHEIIHLLKPGNHATTWFHAVSACKLDQYLQYDTWPKPEVQRIIFTFLGIGYFRFIGGTSRIFRELYLRTSVGADSTTTVDNIVSLVSCVELYLQEKGTNVAQRRVILNGAAQYGRVDILKQLYQRGYLPRAFSEDMCTGVTKHGQLTALIRLKDHGCPVTSAACNNAYEYPAVVESERMLVSWGGDTCPQQLKVVISISYSGWKQLDALGINIRVPSQWAVVISIPCSGPKGMDAHGINVFKCSGGHLNILQWVRANKCPWDKETCSNAALGGNLNILQWARANGCPWDKMMCSYTAEGGHLNILYQASGNGCPLDKYMCSRS